MTLIDVASTTRFGISQALGSCAHGCRLDPHGLVDAGARLEQALEASADLLVLNKFGKAEAEEGGGLRGAVVRAIELGVPVLTAVRQPYDAPWAEFHGGYAVALPPEIDAVLHWCEAAVAARRTKTVRGRAVNNREAVIGIVTASDRASAGVYRDESGPAIEAFLTEVLVTPWRSLRRIVPDGLEAVRDAFIALADRDGCCLILSTGGTRAGAGAT